MLSTRMFACWMLLAGGLAAQAADPAPKTDLHGDALPAGAQVRLGTVRFRQGTPATCLAFSPNDKLLVTGSSDGVVRVWDVSNGRELQHLKGHTGGITAVRFTPDANWIVSAAHDGTLRLWNANTGKEERTFAGHQASVNCLAVSSDSKTLCSAGFDRTIRLWEIGSGKETQQLVGHNLPVLAMSFSPDDKQIVTSAQDGTMRLWDAALGKEVLQFQIGTTGRINHVAFSPDGKQVFGNSSYQAGVHAWDPATGKEVRNYPSSSIARAFALSPAGRFAALAETQGLGVSAAMFVKILGLASGKELRSVEVPGAPIVDMRFSHDGKLLAACGGDGCIRLLDVSAGKLVHGVGGHLGPVLQVEFSADGKHIFTIGADRTLRAWAAGAGNELAALADVAVTLPTLILRPEDGKIVCTSGGRTIATVDPAALLRNDPAALKKQDAPLAAGFINVTTTAANGKLSAAYNSARVIHLIDCEKVQEKTSLALPPPPSGQPVFIVTALALTPEGRTLAGRCTNGMISLWDVEQGKQTRQLPVGGGTGPILFAPDGRSLLTADNFLRLWELCSGRERWRFPLTSAGGVGALAFSPDGQMVAIGNGDGTLSLRSTSGGKELALIATGQGHVQTLRFSPDGQRLASGGRDSTVLVWDVSAHAKAVQRTAITLEPAELAGLWRELADADAGKASGAIDRLAAAAELAVSCVKEHLKPPPQADAKAIARLITELDDDDEKVRDAATSTLEDLGEQALPALRKFLEGAVSLEARTRAQRIVDKQKEGGASAETMRTVRAVEVLELAGTREARALLEALSKDEKSPLLAREAQGALQRLGKK
jgi:WD40 repeat protein